MDGRYPTGLLVAFTSLTDPAKSDDFNYWYNHTHIPDVTEAGVFHHAVRFENTNPDSPHGQFVAIYETTEDASQAMQVHVEAETKLGGREFQQDRRPYQDDGSTPLAKGMGWGIFKRRGGEFVASNKPARGVLIVLTNCKDESRQEEFNRWYEDIHIPDILGTGAFHAAYRYESVEVSDIAAQYLAIYETDNPDPAKAQAVIAKLRPEWQRRGRTFDGSEVVSALNARRIWPTSP